MIERTQHAGLVQFVDGRILLTDSGRRYALPTGDTARGAQCLGDCGPEAAERAVRHGAARAFMRVGAGRGA